MAYVKQNWENLPSTNTPITAERLNHMEDGISEAWEHGGGGAGETLKIGTILPYTGSDSELPTGYMLCDGSELSRTDYSDLFAVIGTSFGDGNGSSTFNLPNLKGKVLTGLDSEDTDFASMGTTGGEKTHTLTIAEMPSHNHDFYFYHINATAVSSGNAQVFDVNNAWINTSKILSKGGSQPHNVLQPYVVVNYIIKVTQSAPVQAQIVGTYTESAIDGYSCNYVNDVINSTIKVVVGSHTVNFSSTGWKHGNFTPTTIEGYKLVAVQSKDIPYGDTNMITYNIYDTGVVYWNAYVGYNGSGNTAHVNLIYVKESSIS